MKTGQVVATDVLINKIQNNTLEEYFKKYSEQKNELYITFGTRRKVEESLDDENHTLEWHRLLKLAIQNHLVVNSLHKYRLKHEFKKLYHKLKSFSEKLTPIERDFITLAFQLGYEVDSDDSRIIRAVNKVKTTPHLRKFAAKLFSRTKTPQGNWQNF